MEAVSSLKGTACYIVLVKARTDWPRFSVGGDHTRTRILSMVLWGPFLVTTIGTMSIAIY